MSNIRVTYSGLISFFLSLITIVIGTGFTLILTRTLTQEEFGIWSLISSLIGYVMITNLIISYWSTRETARNVKSGKTAIVGTMILAICAIAGYIIISILMGNQTQTNLDILMFSSILIPPMFLYGILNAINLGWKPEVVSYGTIIFVISQVTFASLFVYYLDYGVNGVILTNLIAYCISIVILFIYAKNHLKNNLNLFFFKSWLRLSWIPIYPGLFILVDTLGIVIFSAMTGSVLGIAIWAVANTAPAIIKNVQLISRAVYPKLLQGGKKEYVEDNTIQLFYFNILMTGIVIIFAKPALFLLNPIYQDASIVVILLAIRNFFYVLTSIFIQNLGGNETIDMDENATFMQYCKSKLFYPNTLRLIQASIFISLLPVGIMVLLQNNYETIQILNFWAALLVVFTIPLAIYLYLITKKNLEFSLNYIIILKYVAVAFISFISIHFLLEEFLIYNESIIEFLPQVIGFVILAISLYVALTFVVDKKTRDLVKAIIEEIRKK